MAIKTECNHCGCTGWCHGEQVDYPAPGQPCHGADCSGCPGFEYPDPDIQLIATAVLTSAKEVLNDGR